MVAKVRSSALFEEFLSSKDTQRAFFLLDGENRPYMSNAALPEDFVFPSEAEAFRGPRQTLYLNTQASRLPLRLGLAFSPPDRRALLDRSFAAVLAVLAVSALFLFGFYYILRAVAARLRAYALDMEHIAASGFNGRLKASRLYELEEIGLRFDTLGRSFSYVIRARILYHHCLLQQPH